MNTDLAINMVKALISTIPLRFNTSPALTISMIFSLPEAKIIAFGGVATGIIKAQLAATAAGITSMAAEVLSDTATGPNSGKKAAAVAVLLVISVRKIITVVTRTISNSTSIWPSWPI